MRIHPLGIYEKALPKDLTWKERFEIAKKSGFDYVEMSVDETDERLSRLDWTKQQRKDFVSTKIDCGILTPSMCLSGHRKYPFGIFLSFIQNFCICFIHFILYTLLYS